MVITVCIKRVILRSGLFTIRRVAAMVIDFIVYVVKSRVNYLDIYAHDVGENGVDLRNFIATAMPQYFYRDHGYRVKIYTV